MSESCNKSNKDRNQWLALFEALKEKDNLPVICFMFSRKRIHETALDLKSVDFLNEVEKSNVKRYFKEIINRKMSNASDRNLPQVLELKCLLTRGVAIHHSGLLPILKEIVEILFSQGYVKVLFATETFAVGVNMPARSVVFDSISKHDGNKKRLLLPGEFTQMAGRAGRRGLDKIGTVIILIKPTSTIYSQDELKRTLIGSACQLESKFKISYNIILSLYRNRQFNIQHMIRHSFIEANRLKKYDENCLDFEEISEKLKTINCTGLACLDKGCNIDVVNQYYKKCLEYKTAKNAVNEIMESKNELVNFLCAGRLILLDSSDIADFAHCKDRLLIPALVLSLIRQSSGNDKYKLRVLTYDLRNEDDPASCSVDTSKNSEQKNATGTPNIVAIRPLVDEIVHKKINEVIPKIITVNLNDINKVCLTKNRIDVQDIEKYWTSRFFRNSTPWSEWIDNSFAFRNAIQAICGGFKSKLDTANYEKELNIKDSRQRQLFTYYFHFESSESPLLTFPCIDCLCLSDHIKLIDNTEKMKSKVDYLQKALSDDNLAFLPEYRNKLALLKSLEFINADKDTIKLKGRIACEIETYEIVVTEIILSGVFLNAAPCDIAASLSCLMYENKVTNNQSSEIRLSDLSVSLQKILKEVISVVDKINTCQENFNIFNNEIQINSSLVESVKMWSLGHKFSDIVERTDVQSGDIIRCLLRLYELLRHCESASKVMADFGLASLFKKTQETIYRGVVSTTSLYIDDF